MSKKSEMITMAVNIPKHFNAVIGEMALAKNDDAVVILVTNMAPPALLMVQLNRLANGVLPEMNVKDCFQASTYTNKSSAPIPIIKNKLIKFKKGKKDLQMTTLYRVYPQKNAINIWKKPQVAIQKEPVWYKINT